MDKLKCRGLDQALPGMRCLAYDQLMGNMLLVYAHGTFVHADPVKMRNRSTQWREEIWRHTEGNRSIRADPTPYMYAMGTLLRQRTYTAVFGSDYCYQFYYYFPHLFILSYFLRSLTAVFLSQKSRKLFEVFFGVVCLRPSGTFRARASATTLFLVTVLDNIESNSQFFRTSSPKGKPHMVSLPHTFALPNFVLHYIGNWTIGKFGLIFCSCLVWVWLSELALANLWWW